MVEGRFISIFALPQQTRANSLPPVLRKNLAAARLLVAVNFGEELVVGVLELGEGGGGVDGGAVLRVKVVVAHLLLVVDLEVEGVDLLLLGQHLVLEVEGYFLLVAAVVILHYCTRTQYIDI